MTWKIIQENGIDSMPVDVEMIAKAMSIRVEPYSGENTSGVLVIPEEGQPIIGYNPFDSKQRRRFTIAHELGHYCLHLPKHRKSNLLYFDPKVSKNESIKEIIESEQSDKLFRNETYHYSTTKEQEANLFAASLLMPRREVVRQAWTKDYKSEEELVRSLSEEFNVSSVAMSIRLATIGIV